MRTYIISTITVVFIVTGATPAWGVIPSDCSDADLDPYDGVGCDAGGGDVCYWHSGEQKIKCDNLTDYDDTVHAISGNDGSNDITLVFGLANGTEFCCDHNDWLAYYDKPLVVWTAGGDDTVDMTWLTWQYNNTTLIRTGDDDDTVTGSDYDTSCGYLSTWCDQIEVGDGFDEAHGGGGGDLLVTPQADPDDNDLFGDTGEDKLMGGDGDDFLVGGDDQDVIWGGGGVDELFGEGGVDYLYGGSCVDTLSGGTGDDFQCGGIGLSGDDHYGGIGDSDVCGEDPPDNFHTGCSVTFSSCVWSPPF